MATPERTAGRELDAMIAERVMGLTPDRFDPVCIVRRHTTDEAEYDRILGWGGWCYTCRKPISETAKVPPHYSTDIAAAFQVVEAMRAKLPVFFELRWSGSITHSADKVESQGHWVARFADMGGQAFVAADTPAEAICLAALKALDAAAPQRAVEGPSTGSPLSSEEGSRHGGAFWNRLD